MDRRPVFLTFADYYLPGYKAGGPIRAISNLVSTFADSFQFDIVTRDHDLGDAQAYESVPIDAWTKVGGAHVHYLSRRRLSFAGLRALVRAHQHDAIYLNSFFSSIAIRILILRRLGLIPNAPVILAPRGEFSPSALQFKGARKRFYIAIAKFARFAANVVWQASSDHEARDIRKEWDGSPGDGPIEVTPEILSDKPVQLNSRRSPKVPGHLDAAIVLRISDKKNLDGALKILGGVKGRVTWSIYGPIEDPEHWVECQKLIAALPPNVKVVYHGAIAHERVAEVLAEKHLFFFPTIGENFGHAIIEALEVGCPVLISDRTPWRNLEAHGVGWDLPLDRPEAYHEVLERLIDMDEDEHSKLSQNALNYVATIVRHPGTVESNRRLFSSVVDAHRR